MSLPQLAVNRGLMAKFSETYRVARGQGFLTS